MRCRMTSIVGLDAACTCLRTPPPGSRGHRTVAMHPLGLHGIAPPALHGPPAGHEPAPVSCGCDALLRLGPPGAYHMPLVPRGRLPEQDQGRAPQRRQALATPGQTLHAHRTALHTPPPPLGRSVRGAAHQQPLTRPCLRGSLLVGPLQGIQAGAARSRDPARRRGVGQSASPDLIGIG
jgi:hypothetical protein